MRASAFWAAIGVTLLAAACAPTRRPPPPSADIDEDRYRDQLSTLSSAEFHGRRPGTDGETRTVAYLVAEFRRLGLKSASGDNYVQSVPMLEFTPDAPAILSISGHGPALALVAGRDAVIWSSREQSAVSLQGSELVFAGYGIVAAEYGRDDYAGLDVRGKTVVVLAGDPGPPAQPPPAQKTHLQGFYGRAAYKFDEAVRHGASAVLLIHDPQATGIPWQAIVNQSGGARLERDRPGDSTAHAAVQGWLSADAAHALFAAAGIDYAAALAGATGGGFHAQSLGVRADAQIHHSIRHFTSSNVIAVLPGRENHHEYILYSAHWDGLGERASPSGNVLFAGAVDNASGVAGLLQLARSFARTIPKPNRSIVFLATTGGTANLAGSSYYTENPVFALQDTVADLNLDTLRIGGPTRDVTVFGFGQSELEASLRAGATLQGRELHADPNPELGRFYSSDDYSFAAHGVPALYAVGGMDDAARGPEWGRQEFEDFYRHRFATAEDVYHPEWDVRGTVGDLRLYYRLGLVLSQGGRFPNWFHTSEFRGAAADANARGN